MNGIGRVLLYGWTTQSGLRGLKTHLRIIFSLRDNCRSFEGMDWPENIIGEDRSGIWDSGSWRHKRQRPCTRFEGMFFYFR